MQQGKERKKAHVLPPRESAPVLSQHPGLCGPSTQGLVEAFIWESTKKRDSGAQFTGWRLELCHTAPVGLQGAHLGVPPQFHP